VWFDPAEQDQERKRSRHIGDGRISFVCGKKRSLVLNMWSGKTNIQNVRKGTWHKKLYNKKGQKKEAHNKKKEKEKSLKKKKGKTIVDKAKEKAKEDSRCEGVVDIPSMRFQALARRVCRRHTI